MGISQLISGCLLICKITKNNTNNRLAGFPLFFSESVAISLEPRISTTPTKTEKRGKLLNVSPARIIANKEGIPKRFTSNLEDLFVFIIVLKQDKKFTGTLLLLPKGLMNYSMIESFMEELCLIYFSYREYNWQSGQDQVYSHFHH